MHYLIALALLVITSCASHFDKTNIKPGQTIPAQGFSFSLPTHKSWFAVQYGNSHKIHLSQLNDSDSYKVMVRVNKGPYRGMYKNVDDHLSAIKRTRQLKFEKGYQEKTASIEAAPDYGTLCVKYSSSGKNWLGRNNKGPALLETIGLTCAHQTINNVLVNIEITRRYESHAEPVNMGTLAEELFRSVEYYD